MVSLATKKQRVAGVLKRFQFIDLARAVAATGDRRKEFLSEYTMRREARFPSYEPFRACTLGIYGVERGLDLSAKLSRAQLVEAVRRACKGRDEDLNLGAMDALLQVIENDDYRAFDHDPKSLQLAQDRKCFCGLAHYMVRGESVVFQFPYPRRTRLSDYEFSIMMALIRFAYVKDDFESASVEIADLSCETSTVRIAGRSVSAPRSPRVLREDTSMPVDRTLLQTEIEDVYRILLEIAEEPGE